MERIVKHFETLRMDGINRVDVEALSDYLNELVKVLHKEAYNQAIDDAVARLETNGNGSFTDDTRKSSYQLAIQLGILAIMGLKK